MAKEKNKGLLLQMELHSAGMRRLKLLKEKTEAVSYKEVTIKALKLYEHAVDGNLFVKDSQGNLVQIMML